MPVRDAVVLPVVAGTDGRQGSPSAVGRDGRDHGGADVPARRARPAHPIGSKTRVLRSEPPIAPPLLILLESRAQRARPEVIAVDDCSATVKLHSSFCRSVSTNAV